MRHVAVGAVVCVCVSVSLFLYLSVCLSECVHACVCRWLHACVCGGGDGGVCVCAYVCMSECMRRMPLPSRQDGKKNF